MCKNLHYNGFFRLRFFVKKRHGGYTLWSAIDFTVKARLWNEIQTVGMIQRRFCIGYSSTGSYPVRKLILAQTGRLLGREALDQACSIIGIDWKGPLTILLMFYSQQDKSIVK